MTLNEDSILFGLLTTYTALVTWIGRRQISRIDALEKAHAESQEIRVANAVKLDHLTTGLYTHMEKEEDKMEDMHKTMGDIHTDLAVLTAKFEDKKDG